MAEIKKGSFTLPGEAGFESLHKNGENGDATSFATAMVRSFQKILQRQGMVFTLRFA